MAGPRLRGQELGAGGQEEFRSLLTRARNSFRSAPLRKAEAPAVTHVLTDSAAVFFPNP